MQDRLTSLPNNVLERILSYCSAKELAALEATCQYFVKSGIAEKTAQRLLNQRFLNQTPRPEGLEPDYKYVFVCNNNMCIF